MRVSRKDFDDMNRRLTHQEKLLDELSKHVFLITQELDERKNEKKPTYFG